MSRLPNHTSEALTWLAAHKVVRVHLTGLIRQQIAASGTIDPSTLDQFHKAASAANETIRNLRQIRADENSKQLTDAAIDELLLRLARDRGYTLPDGSPIPEDVPQPPGDCSVCQMPLKPGARTDVHDGCKRIAKKLPYVPNGLTCAVCGKPGAARSTGIHGMCKKPQTQTPTQTGERDDED